MQKKSSTEILLNATLVTPEDYADIYEFILDSTLRVSECVRICSLSNGIVEPLPDFQKSLKGVLFELNHVRVNPQMDNQRIIATLTEALKSIGVNIFNPPDDRSMAMCFKPLGEISENVRFFLEADAQAVFLASTGKLRLIPTDSKPLPPNVIKF